MKKNKKNTQEKGRREAQILGIKVDSSELVELLASVEDKISHNKKFYIVTPNPELVVMSQKNSALKEALNNANFSIPDGIGLDYASRFLFGRSLNIIRGRKLFLELIKRGQTKKWKIFLLGGHDNEAELAAKKLDTRYKDIKILSEKGPKLNENGEPATEVDTKLEKDAVDRINKFAPDLLFVAFGNPKQEIWIHKNLKRLKIHGAMVVGGTFRYIAGLSKLPPSWMEKAGLEWLWRLITEPTRIGRILNAFPIFPLKVFWYKVTHY